MALNFTDVLHDEIKLLHIDDEEDSLKLLKLFLNEINPLIIINSISSSTQALTVLESKSFDIIISDYQMPEIDGLELLQIIRRKHDNTPFIILTGKSKEEIAIKALNLGVDFYIQKISDPIVLYTELNHLILQTIEKRRHIIALIKAEERYRALTENSGVGFYQVALNGEITFLNKSMMQILEIPDLKEKKDKKNVFYIAPESLPIVAKHKEKRLKNETSTYQISIITLNGNKRVGIISGASIKDKNGKIDSFIGSFTDITESMSTTETLREKEALIEILTKTFPLGVAVIRLSDGKVLYLNDHAAQCIGLPKETILGRILSEYCTDLTTFTKVVKSIQQGNTVYTGEVKEKRVDGSECWFELSAKEISYHVEQANL